MSMSPDDTIDQLNGIAADANDEWHAAFQRTFEGDPDARSGETVDSDDTSGVESPAASGTAADTDSPPVVEAQEQAPAPADGTPDSSGAGAAGEGASDAPPAGSFTVPLADGTTATFTADQVRSFAELAGWAQSLPDDVREQMAAIEQRRAEALDLSEVERFRAWKQTQASQQRQQTSKWDDFAADLEPEQQAEFAAMRQAYEQQQTTGPADVQPNAQQLMAQVMEGQRREMAFASAQNQWADQRGLTGEEADTLLAEAVQAGIVGQFINANTRINPATGQPLIDPATGTNVVDVARAAQQALDYALINNPELHTRVLEPRPVSPPSPDSFAGKVELKKRNAASVASAPSASVSQPPSDPRNMSSDQQRQGMADFLRAEDAAGRAHL